MPAGPLAIACSNTVFLLPKISPPTPLGKASSSKVRLIPVLLMYSSHTLLSRLSRQTAEKQQVCVFHFWVEKQAVLPLCRATGYRFPSYWKNCHLLQS